MSKNQKLFSGSGKVIHFLALEVVGKPIEYLLSLLFSLKSDPSIGHPIVVIFSQQFYLHGGKAITGEIIRRFCSHVPAQI
jgi:hypothetical protein